LFHITNVSVVLQVYVASATVFNTLHPWVLTWHSREKRV